MDPENGNGVLAEQPRSPLNPSALLLGRQIETSLGEGPADFVIGTLLAVGTHVGDIGRIGNAGLAPAQEIAACAAVVSVYGVAVGLLLAEQATEFAYAIYTGVVVGTLD